MGHLNNVLHLVACGAKNIFFFNFGTFIVLPLLLIYALITIPAVFYRWIVSRILAKSFLCPEGIKSITKLGFGTSYAAEYLFSVSQHPPRPSRNSIVQQSFINGIIPFEKCKDMIRTRWLEAKTTNSSKLSTLKFPELKQHVTSWMGYSFWKDDLNFQLENHIKIHKPLTPLNLDEYCNNLMMDLLNKPFTFGQSPWEIHIVHSCNCHVNKEHLNVSQQQKAVCDQCGKEEMTVLATRIHHCLGDGFSLMFALKTLFGETHYSSENTFTQKLQKAKFQKLPSIYERIITTFQMLVRLCYDLGYIGTYFFWRSNTKTSMHIPDGKKSWHHFYEHSQRFPLQRMKQIKNHFKTSFSALIVSCVATAVSKRLRIVGSGSAEMKNVLMSVAVPLLDKCRVDRWDNNLTGSAYKLPLKANINSVERLYACDKVMKTVNQSLFPQVVFPVVVKLLSFHVTPIVRFGFYNRFFGIGFSNFSTFDEKMWTVNGEHKVVRAIAAAGPYDGVCGILIATLGYCDNFHFLAVTDEAVMKRHELKAVLNDIVDEIDHLYELVQKSIGDHEDKNVESLKLNDFTLAVNQNGFNGDTRTTHRRR